MSLATIEKCLKVWESVEASARKKDKYFICEKREEKTGLICQKRKHSFFSCVRSISGCRCIGRQSRPAELLREVDGKKFLELGHWNPGMDHMIIYTSTQLHRCFLVTKRGTQVRHLCSGLQTAEPWRVRHSPSLDVDP